MDPTLNTLLGSRVPYHAPTWLVNSPVLPSLIPQEKIALGRFPTPMQQLSIPGITDELNIECYIKRDDLSSFDLSGNKVRKLEFLLADATKPPTDPSQKPYDSVITIGGVQSNHCRATAVAARQLGLDPFLILRTSTRKRSRSNGTSVDSGSETETENRTEPKTVAVSDSDGIDDLGLIGNLLFDRMVGADVRLVSAGTYAMIGSDNLCMQLAEELQQKHNRQPYAIPVGGSNSIGVFGYIECVREILAQQQQIPQLQNNAFDHIVFACGSGGTAAGVAIGAHLSGLSDSTQIHAVGVCDSPDIFYGHIEEMATALHVPFTPYYLDDHDDDDKPNDDSNNNNSSKNSVRNWIKLYSGSGIGYAKSTPEELQYIANFAQNTGILLDPVYSGKGLYYFVTKVMPSQSNVFKPGQRLLFIHTGGTVGLYDKATELLPFLDATKVSKMVVKPPTRS